MHNIVTWVKSSLSFSNGNCVEVRKLQNGDVSIRDSNRTYQVIHTTPEDFRAFIEGAKKGEFDAFCE